MELGVKIFKIWGEKMLDKFYFVLGIVFVLAILLITTILVQAEDLIPPNLNETEIMPTNPIPISSYELSEGRTYTSQIFKNNDNTFTAVLSAGNMFYFDGDNFMDINTISEPMIQKENIYLEKMPETLEIPKSTFKLGKGISAKIDEEGNLMIKDAKETIIGYLTRPFSIDNKSNILLMDYEISQINNELTLGVKFDEKWFETAEYPVLIDPSLTLTNNTGIYDGHMTAIARDDTSNSFIVGCSRTNLRRGFIEFNTSTVSDSVTITDIWLGFTIIDVGATFAGHNVTITRFNNSQISSNITYPTNVTGNTKLYNIIPTGTGSPSYLVNSTSFQTTGLKILDLGASSDTDLQNQLSADYFGVGFFATSDAPYTCDSGDANANININSSEGGKSATGPKLLVTYTSCPNFISGDQYCNNTCTYISSSKTVPGDLYVQDSCTLTLGGNTKFYWDTLGHYIYIYKGGTIFLNDTAQLSSPTAP